MEESFKLKVGVMPTPPALTPNRVRPPPKVTKGVVSSEPVAGVLELRQQGGDGGGIRLIDAAGGDQLIDEAAGAGAQSGQQRRADIEGSELRRQRGAQGVRQTGADGIHAHVEQNLRPARGKAADQVVGGVQHRQLRPNADCGLRLIHSNEAQVKQHAQRVGHLRQLLIGQLGEIEGPQAHAIEVAMIFDGIGEQENLLGRERDPEGLGDVVGRAHGGSEVDVLNVEVHMLLLDRVVELRADAVGAGHFGEQRAGIAAEVEVLVLRGGLQLDGHRRIGNADSLRCGIGLGHGVAQPLHRVVVGRVVFQRAAEVGHGDDFVLLHHRLIAVLQRLHGQLLPGNLARGDVIDIAGIKLGGTAEFVEGRVEMALGLQLHAGLELTLGFGGLALGDGRNQMRSERRGSACRSCCRLRWRSGGRRFWSGDDGCGELPAVGADVFCTGPVG